MKLVLVAAAVLSAVPVGAVTRGEGQAVSEGDKRFDAVGGHNGSQWLPVKMDDDGNTLVRNKSFLYGASLTIVSALALSSNQANTNNPLTGAGLTPYTMGREHGTKWVRVLVTGAPTNSPPWSIRFYASRDNGTSYAPLMRSLPNASSGFFIGAGEADTLKVRGRGAMTGNGVWFPLTAVDDEGIPFSHIAAVCSADSTLAAASYTFTVEIAGREQ